MKPTLLILALSALLSHQIKAQNTRWMYLGNDNKRGEIYLVDTVRDDIREPQYYEGHANSVLFWTNTYKRTKLKNGITVINTDIIRMAVDTVEKQIQLVSVTLYKNDSVTDAHNTPSDWFDVVPGTIGELYLKYAKSLHNPYIKGDMFLTAYLNYNPYNPKPKKP